MSTVITPIEARRLLANTPAHQRRMNQAHVRRLAQDMREGRWVEESPVPIIVTGTDQVIDGQHRLAAIVEADRPVTMVVARTDHPDLFAVVDQGMKRNAAQFLSGRTSSTRTVAARLILQYRNDPHTAPRTTYRASISELLDVAEEFSDEQSLLLAEKVRSVYLETRVHQGVLLAIALLAREHAPEERLNSWLQGLQDGEFLAKNDPRHLVRQRFMLQHKQLNTGNHIPQTWQLLVKAWNAHHDQRTMGTLKVAKNEPPQLILGHTPVSGD